MSFVKLSIIIPCYNHGAYVRESIEAMREVQSAYTYEVIVVNDGSTENETLEVMSSLEGKGIQVLHQRNMGLSAARNSGIREAKGELILPLDADNILLEDYLNYGIARLEEDKQLDVVYSNLLLFGAETGLRRVSDFNYCSLFRANYIDACAIFRKSGWKLVGGYDENLKRGYEDWDMWMRMAIAGLKFKHINSIGFKYRVRKGSMLREANKRKQEIVDQIFCKPEYESVRWIQDLIREKRQYGAKAGSWEYKIGNILLTPARQMQRLLKGKQ